MRDGLAKAALTLNRWSDRFLPSALGIAALLTLVCFLLAHLAYIALTLSGRRLGQLDAKAAKANLARLCPLIVERYGTQADMAGMCAAMPALAVGGEAAEAEFLALWQVYSGAAARRALPPLA